MENWRRYLNERRTDVVYDRVSEYFLDIIENYKKYFKVRGGGIAHRAATWIMKKALRIIPSARKDIMLIFYGLQSRPEEFNEEEFKRYQEMTGDSTIMPTYESFKEAMSKLTITWVDEEAFPPNMFGMKGAITNDGDIYISQIGRPASIEFAVKNLLGGTAISSTLIHEMTHWFNLVRSKYTEHRTSGQGRNLKLDPRERSDDDVYANSTEEIQARLIPIFKNLRKLFEKRNFNFSEKGVAGTVIRLYYDSIDSNDPREFLRMVINRFQSDLRYYELNEKQKRRVINRILEMFEYFKENREKFPILTSKNRRKFPVINFDDDDPVEGLISDM